MTDTRVKLEKICKQFSKTIGNELDSVFKLERNDRDGYFISSTPTRAQTLKKKMFNYSNNKYTITKNPLYINIYWDLLFLNNIVIIEGYSVL